MTRIFRLPSPLYGIFDPAQCRDRPLDSILDALLEAGVKLIQLRCKEFESKEFLSLAKRVRRETARAGCFLIVNDRVDVALASGADGVHLGQEDLPLSAARKLMGHRIIGISTHDPAQALEAERGGADYIGFGPIFGTRTKKTGYDPRGLERLRQVRTAVGLPIVAIGGISESRVREVWEAGADGAAMISHLTGVEDIRGTVRRVLALAQPSSASSPSE